MPPPGPTCKHALECFMAIYINKKELGTIEKIIRSLEKTVKDKNLEEEPQDLKNLKSIVAKYQFSFYDNIKARKPINKLLKKALKSKDPSSCLEELAVRKERKYRAKIFTENKKLKKRLEELDDKLL